MELYISDHPLDCLTCPPTAIANCRIWPGESACATCAMACEGENHLDAASKVEPDTSNPYFQYDPAKCIVCSRCVRACEEVQGTFALTIEGRGFESRVSAGIATTISVSDCVSCGACVQACPTATLVEKIRGETGTPNAHVLTTCAYCGVGCSFKAEMQGEKSYAWCRTRMAAQTRGIPASRAASPGAMPRTATVSPRRWCATPSPTPGARCPGTRHWPSPLTSSKRIQARTAGCIGGITSSAARTRKSTVVQKMIRAAFGNNNVDTCARVCHSPTGYGLKQTFGTSAGTQDFKSVEEPTSSC